MTAGTVVVVPGDPRPDDAGSTPSTVPVGGVGPALATVLATVLSEVLHVEQVSVEAHFFDDLGADSMVMAQFCARVRKRTDLPPVSIKDVYQHPTIEGLATALAPPSDRRVAGTLAEVLAEVLHVERLPVEAHFFDDLGADSMVMAQFCARVRKRTDLPPVSIKDVYEHPTIERLAAALGPATEAVVAPPPPAAETRPRAGTGAYVVCGALQLLIILGYAYVAAVVIDLGLQWIWAGGTLLDIYVRATVVGSATLLCSALVPVLVKWLLIGRWTRRSIRIWSLGYVRFWAVKTLITLNPMVLFAGTPLYTAYLRALGAKIAPGVVILTRHPPVCTDLVSIGSGTVVRKDAFLTGYRASAGWIETGRVTLGRDVFVGEKAVLDIETAIGDGAQLGHVSSLHAGQAVPPGEHWHGSPAEPTRADYQGVAPAACSARRRAVFTFWQLLPLVLVYLPLGVGGVALLFVEVPWLATLLTPGSEALTTGSFYGTALAVSAVLFVGVAVAGLLITWTVPRLLNLLIEPGRTYPLYGIHYAAHRTITRMTNRRFFVELFGDSSYVVGYLSRLGYRLAPLVQTGSNFGSELKHENPYQCSVGSGTVIASGLSFANADYSSTSFKVSMARIGANNFLGNDIVYPPQGRTGEDCLLATKVLVPIDGPVRDGVGLLGSPSFEIPRTVDRDSAFVRMAHGPDVPQLLAAKNRHNLATMAMWLLAKWGYTFGLVLLGLAIGDLHGTFGVSAIAVGEFAFLVFTLFYVCFVERASTGFRGVRPTYCSIYQIGFWRSERFFKLQAGPGLNAAFIGTPFQSWFWRMVGVRLGRRLFDDGCGMSEKNLVTIGDDVTLNAGAFIQCHSQEDYAFKSDHTTVGSGGTVGVAALVHYGVTMGPGASLAADSFLMKGEEMPEGAGWGGNPARELRDRDLRYPTVHGAATDRGTRAPALPAGGVPAPRSGRGRHRADRTVSAADRS